MNNTTKALINIARGRGLVATIRTAYNGAQTRADNGDAGHRSGVEAVHSLLTEFRLEGDGIADDDLTLEAVEDLVCELGV